MQKLIRRQSTKKGFTLIELSLSIAFIGILSITVALIINNAIMSYRRGLTLNQINTVGMDLVDDMRTSIQNSPTKSAKDQCSIIQSTPSVEQHTQSQDEFEEATDEEEEDDISTVPQEDASGDCSSTNGLGFVSIKSSGNIAGVEEVPLYGAFCTGTYSYLWNSGYFFSDEYEKSSNKPDPLTLEIGDKIYNNFKLLKIHDINRAVCISAVGGYENNYDLNSLKNNPTIKIDAGSIVLSANDGPYDLLAGEYVESGGGDKDKNTTGLAIYDLSSTAPVGNDSVHSLFYSVSFILGTPRGGINVNATGDFCKPPEDYDNSFDYCAINKFNFAAQATGV